MRRHTTTRPPSPPASVLHRAVEWFADRGVIVELPSFAVEARR
jgi:hypothetical protein